MDAQNKLLDKVRETCSIPSDGALADRLNVSRQLVNHWRKGRNPMPDATVAHLCGMAHLDAGHWLVLVRADLTQGEASRAWQKLARQLGAAAALAVVSLFAALPGKTLANEQHSSQEVMHYAKS